MGKRRPEVRSETLLGLEAFHRLHHGLAQYNGIYASEIRSSRSGEGCSDE